MGLIDLGQKCVQRLSVDTEIRFCVPLTLCLLVLSVDNLCKEFGHRSDLDPAECLV